MKYTATCPACKKESSLLSIMLAMTPFSFKCSKCRARIFVRGVTIALLSIMAVMGVVAIMFLKLIFFSEQQDVLAYFIFPALIVIMLEFLSAVVICNKGRLVVK